MKNMQLNPIEILITLNQVINIPTGNKHKKKELKHCQLFSGRDKFKRRKK